jgi:hypothetical protein
VIAGRMAGRMAAIPVNNLKYIHNAVDFYMYIWSILTNGELSGGRGLKC